MWDISGVRRRASEAARVDGQPFQCRALSEPLSRAQAEREAGRAKGNIESVGKVWGKDCFVGDDRLGKGVVSAESLNTVTCPGLGKWMSAAQGSQSHSPILSDFPEVHILASGASSFSSHHLTSSFHLFSHSKK